MMENETLTGAVVYSLAGRDSGGLFLVIQDVDDSYVYIADGMRRRLEKPKKKKRKHLRLLTDTNFWQENYSNVKMNNAALRNALNEFARAQVQTQDS